MSLISEALMAMHSMFLVDPIMGPAFVLYSLLAMMLTSGFVMYVLGKVSGKSQAERRGLTVDEIAEEIWAMSDPWDVLYLWFTMEHKVRPDNLNSLVLIGCPESTKA